MLKKLLEKLFPKRKIRKELKLVSYTEGDKLVREGWTIAKEEDNNHLLGFVYLEFLVDVEEK